MVETTTVCFVLKELVRWQHCKKNKTAKLIKTYKNWQSMSCNASAHLAPKRKARKRNIVLFNLFIV